MENTWIVIPGLNEEKYIGTVLEKVSKQTKNIIVVDDGSHDKMPKIARSFTPHVVCHSINLGKGAALKTGCEYAFNTLKADAVIFMDSDDQHDPEELPLFIDALKKSDVVFGVRSFDEKMPLFRIMMNRLASAVIFFLFGEYVPDIPSGYKALSKHAYPKLAWESTDYAVEMELAARTAKHKIQFTTVPVKTIYHDFERGMTILDSLRMITKILSWRITL